MFRLSDEVGPGLHHIITSPKIDDPIKYGQLSAIGAKDFVADAQVEFWLCELEFKMRETLYEVLRDSKGTSELWDVTELAS